MAHDLASGPTAGAQVQACGDCHLLNFGLFATPERNLIFDLRDHDETLLPSVGVGRQAARGKPGGGGADQTESRIGDCET